MIDGRITVVTHKGKKILLIDFSHCSPQDMMPLLDEVRQTIAKRPPNSLLTLADFTSTKVDRAVAERIKEVLVFDRPHVMRSAWVGTDELPKVFYQNFKSFSQRDFPLFATREEAMEWLAE
jgi:hypothetical protein